MRSTRAREVQMATNFGVGQLYKRKDFLETEDEAKIHPNRTYYFRKSVDLDELVRQCDRTLLNDATNAKALFVRASSSMKLKRYERAIEDYTRLIALNPRDTVSIYKRGAAYERLNRMNESIRDYSDVLRLDPGHVNAAYAREWFVRRFERRRQLRRRVQWADARSSRADFRREKFEYLEININEFGEKRIRRKFEDQADFHEGCTEDQV